MQTHLFQEVEREVRLRVLRAQQDTTDVGVRRRIRLHRAEPHPSRDLAQKSTIDGERSKHREGETERKCCNSSSDTPSEAQLGRVRMAPQPLRPGLPRRFERFYQTKATNTVGFQREATPIAPPLSPSPVDDNKLPVVLS